HCVSRRYVFVLLGQTVLVILAAGFLLATPLENSATPADARRARPSRHPAVAATCSSACQLFRCVHRAPLDAATPAELFRPMRTAKAWTTRRRTNEKRRTPKPFSASALPW